MLCVSDLRADTHGDLMSVIEAVAAKTAATNAAVAAAATAAAAETAAASKAAALLHGALTAHTSASAQIITGLREQVAALLAAC